jgi:hypothetical protein
MSKQMWFGTRGHERWVKAPASSADFSRKGFAAQLSFTNGGASVRRSRSTHAEYSMNWPVAGRLELRSILDFAGHVYDNDPLAQYLVADNLMYFIDPMEMGLNLAPTYWGNPILSCTDGPSLFSDARPEPVSTGVNTADYPTFSAEYTFTAATEPRSFYLPIPPGHTLHAGFHGSVTGGAGVEVTPVDGVATTLTPLGLAQTRVTDSFNGVSGVDIKLTGSIGDTLTLSALILQIIRSDQVPEAGGYISGRGHSGCAFSSEPIVIALSSVNELAEVSGSAKLVEVGAWI